ncbi:hypothetical protein NIIDMKKI_18580 [Mycobacterium kansasii]|uniref:Glyoxalase/fosfomycin resistance/dioxygenase domain-containing protein n=1 Tax=Mycobacterium kansasii TaxID=1768 RepID=A0A7G1I9Y4_MYCKA|nr:hypothetical protein NIIDMKKI_18580 [Mycobacterium kansasii]
MTTDQVDARQVVATSLVTGLDHVGIAVADLDAAIEWYHEHLGMILVHEELNDDQGIREAMLAVPGSTAQIQLMAPMDESSAIAKFLQSADRASSSSRAGSPILTPSAADCARRASVWCTRLPGVARRIPESTSSIPRTPAAC